MLFPLRAPAILIVDDNPSARALMRTVIPLWCDTELIEADSFDDAVECINHHKIDIIITDLVMRPKDGADLFEYVMNFNSVRAENIRVIGITAYGDGPVFDKAKRYGLDTILTKPLNVQLLKEAIADKFL